ncbi:MAG: hypothetical protein RJA44_1708 [Pseudomonadota bacterium]|jgi:hypothetical protein
MDEDYAFAPPPFDSVAALERLRRSLRELRPLQERAGPPLRYELSGQTVLELLPGSSLIEARLARQPARTPQWQPAVRLQDSAALRDFIERVRRQLAVWTDD